jgi:undecaprenyl-diphosphatase
MSQVTEPLSADRALDLKNVRTVLGPLLGSLASAAAFLILFGWLVEEVFEGDLQQFDLRTRNIVHHFATPTLTKIMQGLTWLGSPAALSILFGIVVACFVLGKLRGPAAWLVVAMIGALLLDATLKLAFHRARPVPFFGTAPASYSFPSGHALGSFIFYGVIAGLLCARIERRFIRILIWLAAALLVTGIGVSRIYLGVHHPTDVIAGYIAGAAWVSTLLFADRVQLRRTPHQISH